MKAIFPQLSCKRLIALLAFLFATFALPATAQIYNKGDIAVINNIIDKNGLKWEKAPADGSDVPADWAKVKWSTEATNRRVKELDLYAECLTGELDVSGLVMLEKLDCSYNQLTTFDVSGLTGLWNLSCTNNQLTSLDLTDLTLLRLDYFGVDQTSNLTLYLNPTTQKYEAPISLNNPTNLAAGLTYSNGKLIADDNSVLSTLFTVETGLAEQTLSGTIYLTYSTTSANESAAGRSALKAVYANGALIVSGLSVGDELRLYDFAGAHIYNVRAGAQEVRIDIGRGIYIVASGRRAVKVVAK